MIDEPEPRRDTSAEERTGATAAARAWNERYPRTRQVWSGEPNAMPVAELEGLASGRAPDRVFQQALGQAPMKYLVDWRMTLSPRPPAHPEPTDDRDRRSHRLFAPYAFAAAFRRQHGQPPGRWRQQQASTGLAGILTH
jgi:hypothetical protein